MAVITGTFQNSQVAQIIGISQRQVIAWTEKGLVDPMIDASGAGTKRGYNYFNLLEFGLCKKLLGMGLGIQTAKRIMTDLRAAGMSIDWALNFAGPREQLQREVPEEDVRDHGSAGLLIVILGKDGQPHSIIAPFEIDHVFNFVHLREEISESNVALIVDLGAVRAEIDKKI